MNIEEAKQLLGKYENGTATADEVKLIENWYMAVSREQKLDVAEADFTYMKALIWADTLKSAGLQEDLPKTKVIKLWPRIAAAVAVVVVLFGAGLFYFSKNTDKRQITAYKNDVAPGKQGATLTLGNGKKIVLSDATNGELARESGVVITKAENGQLAYEIKEQNNAGTNKINTLTTAKGETYQVKLPDGTSIWLNAASTLKYPASFAKLKTRNVELIGEAYFEVAKDNAHPFIVESADQQVEVLGTHFNVSAYPEEAAIKTTLAEGSVKVTSFANSDVNSRTSSDINSRMNDRHPEFISGPRTSTAIIKGSNTITLKPNQQSTLKDNTLQISNIDAEYALAWKNGYFLFNSETLESIMTKVSRWYNVKVSFADPALKSKTFTGTISRFENVSKVLNMLEWAGVVAFKVEKDKITVDKKK